MSISRNRIALAITAIAFGAGLITMAAISVFHTQQMTAVYKAHRGEIAAQERRHTREKKQMHREIIDRLEKLRCDK